MRAQIQRRSAGFQPAVSPTSSRQAIRAASARADWKSGYRNPRHTGWKPAPRVRWRKTPPNSRPEALSCGPKNCKKSFSSLSILRRANRLLIARTIATNQQTNNKETKMRFMVMVKASKNSEAGVMPSKQLLADMGKFNEELTKAGVMLTGEGLQSSAKGARVRFSGDKKTVIDGPFAETKELVAGFWMWKCNSLQEAIDWVKRCPNPMGPNQESEIEIRQIFEAEDFGADFTPELREHEDRLRKEIAAKR